MLENYSVVKSKGIYRTHTNARCYVTMSCDMEKHTHTQAHSHHMVIVLHVRAQTWTIFYLLYWGRLKRCQAYGLESWPVIWALHQNQYYPPKSLDKPVRVSSVLVCSIIIQYISPILTTEAAAAAPTSTSLTTSIGQTRRFETMRNKTKRKTHKIRYKILDLRPNIKWRTARINNQKVKLLTAKTEHVKYI